MRKRRVLIAAGIVLLLYVAAYLGLSRRGYATAHEDNMPGFYYFTPVDSYVWRFSNYGCVFLFWPLNAVDQWFGTGMTPAYEPLWELSG